MATRKWGDLAQAMTRSLASVAIFAQLLLIITPLVDVHEQGEAQVAALITQAPTGGSALTASQPATPEHNATTCPACIAQSLHAQLASGVRLPLVVVAESAPLDVRPTLLPHHDPPQAHQSRAPPAVS
ncbi:MAG: hypothetical protein V4503_05920 [Gemmatimonadota bacterium]